MSSKKDTIRLSEIVPTPLFSEHEYHVAVSRILEHQQSIIKFKSTLSSAINSVFDGDYSLGRISHNYFSHCEFKRASLESVTGAGSIFENVKFVDTNLQNSNFQNSTFEHCSFDGCRLNGCNVSGSFFKDVSWINVQPGVYNASGSYYRKCAFSNSKPGNLAEACLDDLIFDNVRLTNVNIEYATFKSIQSQNLILPFSQMPYVFNGLQYLLRTSDNVKISSHKNAEHCISVAEYTNSLHDMIVFYSYRKEYFPLASILLAFQRYEEALNTILKGMLTATMQRDFRMCKYFCKLLTDNGHFSKDTLKDLYHRLHRAIQMHTLSEAEYYQYLQHIPEIRSMLVDNPGGHPHATLILRSQITSPESAQANLLLTGLDELIHLRGTTLVNPSISIRHNSPLEFVVNLCGTPMCILAVAALILNMVSNVCKSYNEIAQTIINNQTIAANHRQKELDNLEKERLVKEIDKIELENAELRERISETRRQVTESGIIIAHAELMPLDFDPIKVLSER